MMTLRPLIALSLVAASCTSSKTPSNQHDPAGSLSATSNTVADQPVVLTQTSLLPGTTAVDPSAARVLFYSTSIRKRDIIAPLLSRNASFLSDEGETVVASAELTSFKMPPDGLSISVMPVGILKPDHWYTLVINQSADLQLSNGKSLEELNARNNTVWRSDFFTGSAPHLIRALAPSGPKDGVYLHVVFSEPIGLSSIEVSQFLNVDGKPFSKCILLSGVCASSMDGVRSEEFDIAPNGPLGQFRDMSFAVSDRVVGSGRTVAEGQALAVSRVPSMVSSKGMVRIGLTSNDWLPCENGAARCWHGHN